MPGPGANAGLHLSLKRAEEANKALARAAEGWYSRWQDAATAFACAKEVMVQESFEQSFEQWTLKVEDTSIAPTGF